jgi:hypothetical protein
MPTVTITNTDLIFITLNIDGISTIIKKTWCQATASGNNLILKWFNESINKRYNYEQTILETDVTLPAHTDINDLLSIVNSYLTNSGGGGFSSVYWSKLSYVGFVDGINTGFTISDTFVGNVDIIQDGGSLKLGDVDGYTISVNVVTCAHPPRTLDIWGNIAIP